MTNKLKAHDSDFLSPLPPLRFTVCFLAVTIFTIITASLTSGMILKHFNLTATAEYFITIFSIVPLFIFVNMKIAWGNHSYIITLKKINAVVFLLLVFEIISGLTTNTSVKNSLGVQIIVICMNAFNLYLLYSETYFSFVTYKKNHIRVMHKLRDGKPLEEIEIED
ncbi:hypothetical protein CYL31_18925 [Marinomonas sp. A3A]|uniref:hypothetical protein n=1 Tax=Marinomonas sp. A3A TaxID=2065312 RepID=UPI001BB34C49|nr:hypothetical protein [Marinomonas sp. A3A]QUX93347.1 hypothetical protein CYL31_18925 [Marinomonas sp. A3A]